MTAKAVGDKRILQQGDCKNALCNVTLPETWVLTPRMQRVMGGFHHRVAHRLMGRQPQKGWDVGWVYPHMGDEITEAGLQEVDTYISF